ncbi:MAG TPA: N-acetylmuramoyl-L-alanine amidase [Thermoanaerobaculia bacterium]|jgi:N-acetylmuramoyl-L-alanine amidase
MKRLLLFGALALLALASIVLAQTAAQAILRTPTGDHPVGIVTQGGQTYVSASDAAAALGGSVTPDSSGFKMSVNGVVAAFGADSRFGVVRDDLIEMPVPPIAIEGKPYVPWQFFQGLLGKTASMDVTWDAAANVLLVRPQQRDVVDVQVSVANVQGISKIVITLSAPAEYGIVKEPQAYTVRFRSPIRAPFPEQTYEDPYIARLAFSGSDLRIALTAPDVVGDAYRLENPPRIVLDLRKAAAPVPGALPPQPGATKPRELPGIRTIVIDPGHGGKDVGAIGPGGVLEKDVTLAVARKLADSLAAKTGARVVLTREDDSVVSLDQRTATANQYNADLFLSVHMNAAVVKNAKGSETYFLSLEASDELARKAADLENASAAAHAPSAASPDLNLILWDLAQQTYLDESSRFAQAIQEEMNAATGVTNRGVKQAPFKVLVGATMPAALVEVGFITNAEEAAKLQSAEFQTLMVDALTRAVQRYKTDYETRIGLIQPPAPTPSPAATATAAPSAPATTTAAPATKPAPTTTAKPATTTSAPAAKPPAPPPTTAPATRPAPTTTTTTDLTTTTRRATRAAVASTRTITIAPTARLATFPPHRTTTTRRAGARAAAVTPTRIITTTHAVTRAAVALARAITIAAQPAALASISPETESE